MRPDNIVNVRAVLIILVVFQVAGTLAALPGSSMSPTPSESLLRAVQKRS